MKMSFVTHKQAVNASCESEIHGKSLCSWLNRALPFPVLHESSSGKTSTTGVIFILNSNMRCSTNLDDTAQNAVDLNAGQLCLSVWKLSGLKIYPFPGGLSWRRISFLDVLNPCFAVCSKLPTNWRLNGSVIVVLKKRSCAFICALVRRSSLESVTLMGRNVLRREFKKISFVGKETAF
jgi:hypothetical protein